MDAVNEKKWFVYLGDRHEGPFTLDEIKDKMASGQVSVQNFVWAEGMADWKPMTELPEFKPLVESAQSSSQSGHSGNTGLIQATGTSPTMLPGGLTSGGFTRGTSPTIEISGHRPGDQGAVGSLGLPVSHPNAVPYSGRGASNLLRLAIPVSILLAGAAFVALTLGILGPLANVAFIKATSDKLSEISRPMLAQVAAKVPALGKWISIIPSLDDVKPEEYEELRKAAMQPMDAGPVLALAMSHADPLGPHFYVATNVPDGTKLEIFVVGHAETLLNQTAFFWRGEAVVSRNMARTGRVAASLDGKPLPRGEYTIVAMETEGQTPEVAQFLSTVQPSPAEMLWFLPKGRKLPVKKTYFLGGPRDESYQSRLKEYHEKLIARAKGELQEVKQISMLLESQMNSSISLFEKLRKSMEQKQAQARTKAKGRQARKKPEPAFNQQAAWKAFHTKWLELFKQLETSFQRWTPEALNSEYYYPMLYQLTRQAGDAVARIHQLHDAFFTTKTDPKSLEIQIGEVGSQASTSLATLKTKIALAEKLAADASGFPRKEGL